MIHRNICPICGNENPEESQYCQVCHADLGTLPDDVFHTDPDEKSLPADPVQDPALTEPGESDLDSPIPTWMKTRLQEKQQNFDTYIDAIFGSQDPQKSVSPNKVRKPAPRKSKAKSTVFQPELEKLMDPPLIEKAEEKAAPENIPGLNDFSTLRPVKKWDDPVQDKVIENVRQQTDKAFYVPEQIPLLWQQDPALVEDFDAAKTAEDDDEDILNSVSPTKLADYEALTAAAATADPSAADSALIGTHNGASAEPGASAARAENTEFKPESGSLLSDLWNEMNLNSVTPAPQELEQNAAGTVFYSGESGPEEEHPAEPDVIDIPVPAEDNGGNAAFLDQILQNIGYHVESTVPEKDPAPAVPEKSHDVEKISASSMFDPEVDPVSGPSGDTLTDPALAPDVDPALEPDSDERKEKGPDPALIETDPLADRDLLSEETDNADEQEIPWDLFGSQDMSLPQSPEDPAYRTFSRSSIPEEPGSTTYQQRMMSSVLGKIIRAENYVAPLKKSGNRKISIWARLFWSLAALGGIVLILMTDITGRLTLPAVPAAPASLAFYDQAENMSGSALVVLDYTPAYGAELDTAADKLIRTLEEKAGKVYIGVLNPAAMPRTQELLKAHAEKAEFSGWWPAGVLSIRSHLESGNVPDHIWLVTSEISSVRSWAEQLAVSGGDRQLHVLASGQLEPLLSTYLKAGLVTGAMSRDRDLLHYGSQTNNPDRHLFAVWYLAGLLPLAWICGNITRFLRSDPNYGRKKIADKESGNNPEKEAENDGSL